MSKKSIFDKKKLKDIYAEIQKVYLSDDRPWVIAFSGGKDSTVILQLVWEALSLLDKKDLKKPVDVVTSNTLVESPVLLSYVSRIHKEIDIAAKDQKLPIRVHRVNPKIEETFWVNVIGKGYPSPTQQFRWCTTRMKIDPMDKFIFNEVSRYGEVILVLGVRSAESSSRAQSMESHRIKDSLLSRHAKFSQAFVYAPIAEFSTEDVWTYLLQKRSPWGSNNRDLLSMYAGKNSKECPLIVDKNSPSCGGSRFGCWTCTLVKEDKTMNQLINDGNKELKPMADLRNLLYKTTIPENKAKYREYKGRNGKLRLKEDGTIIRGPYKLDFSKEILKSILKIQKGIEKSGIDLEFSVISPEEIHEIRRLWLLERGDWEDSIPKIYKEVMGKNLDWLDEELGLFSEKENDMLRNISEKEGIPIELVRKLLDLEKQIQGMTKRSAIYSKIDKILSEEWRPEKQIIEGIKAKNDN
jgi:DNA sulfur modification protein DndC